jgi:hypothetical protein
MSTEKADRDSGRSWSSWLMLFLAFLGAAILFVLRRSVVRLFPLLLILAISIPVIVYLYRRHRYRELEDVYAEYAPLRSLLRQRGLYTYQTLMERSMTNLLNVRDQAENVAALLAREDPQILYRQIVETRKTAEKATDPAEKELHEKQVRDLEANLENLQKLKRFLDKYHTSKKLLAGYFRSIQMKLHMDIISEEISVSEQNREIDQIVEDVENLTHVYERVDRMMEEEESS